jgi:hypothetical protein
MHDADSMCFEAIESTHESTMAELQSFIENDPHEEGLEYGHNEEDIAADNMVMAMAVENFPEELDTLEDHLDDTGTCSPVGESILDDNFEDLLAGMEANDAIEEMAELQICDEFADCIFNELANESSPTGESPVFSDINFDDECASTGKSPVYSDISRPDNDGEEEEPGMDYGFLPISSSDSEGDDEKTPISSPFPAENVWDDASDDDFCSLIFF